MRTIHDRLVELYGPSVSADTHLRLNELIQRHRQTAPNPDRPLAEQDVILITYGDQVLNPDHPPLHTLAEFCLHWLPNVVSGIHILPFYPSSSDDGFSVIDYSAVDPHLGDWPDLDPLRERFDLMFDAVFNHMSAQSDWFQRFLHNDPSFHDFFVTVDGQHDLSQVVRPRALPLLTQFHSQTGPRQVWTTFSADQVDLNFKNPAVLLRTTEILLQYAARGARFIRLDAIAYLWKEIGTACIHLPQTHQVIQLWRAILDQVHAGVRLITETNVPHVDNISYFGDGTNEAQLVYNFALPPLVLHSLLRHNASALTRWAQQLQLPSDRVTFFNFLASHDGIGLNPARSILSQEEIDRLVDDVQSHGGFVSYKDNPDGSRSPYELNINFFDALSNPASSEDPGRAINRFLVAHSILLTLRGVPGIYFHSLFGSRGDRAGAETSGIARRINRQKLHRATLEAELHQSTSLRHQIFHRLQAMLRSRRAHSAFHPSAPQTILDLAPHLFVVGRGTTNSGNGVWCIHNVTDSTVELVLPPDNLGPGTNRIDLLSGASVDLSRPLQLDPFQVLWLS
jgi:glucosylglycerate phosphorylase